MAHGLNDDEISIDADKLLKQMKERLLYLEQRIEPLEKLKLETEKLKSAIRAYENHGKVTTRSRDKFVDCDVSCLGCDNCRRGPAYR